MASALQVIVDKLLTHAVSVSRALYLRRSVYLPTQLAVRFRRLQLAEGFQQGDLVRILIALGLAYGFNRLGQDEWAFQSALTRALDELQRLTREGTKRHYPVTKGTRGCGVTVSMPKPLLNTINLYSKISGESRNHTLTLLLRNGLLLYLLTEKNS